MEEEEEEEEEEKDTVLEFRGFKPEVLFGPSGDADWLIGRGRNEGCKWEKGE